ncbi:MAG: AzlD domain-containing protein [Chloroflexaceae bacterium]|nr:AzlD domain-containing protein [Chloroflexaceae bacterium]NJO07770.1 AzlD domain-containing protein [Chloroflexaceae bacterium]NJO83081.1 AzlD domain-containing protein [Blastochloris sp.]
MLSEPLIWLVTAIVGLITLTLRSSFIVLAGRISMPDLLLRGLRFVPPAVLAALIVPPLVFHASVVNLPWVEALPWLNERTLAGTFAVLVMWRSRSVLLTIVAGMVSLWVLQWLL